MSETTTTAAPPAAATPKPAPAPAPTPAPTQLFSMPSINKAIAEVSEERAAEKAAKATTDKGTKPVPAPSSPPDSNDASTASPPAAAPAPPLIEDEIAPGVRKSFTPEEYKLWLKAKYSVTAAPEPGAASASAAPAPTDPITSLLEAAGEQLTGSRNASIEALRATLSAVADYETQLRTEDGRPATGLTTLLRDFAKHVIGISSSHAQSGALSLLPQVLDARFNTIEETVTTLAPMASIVQATRHVAAERDTIARADPALAARFTPQVTSQIVEMAQGERLRNPGLPLAEAVRRAVDTQLNVWRTAGGGGDVPHRQSNQLDNGDSMPDTSTRDGVDPARMAANAPAPGSGGSRGPSRRNLSAEDILKLL